MLALKIKPVIAAKAKENMLATQNNNAASACQKSDKQIDTKKEVAKVAGVSHDTIAKVVEYDIFAGFGVIRVGQMSNSVFCFKLASECSLACLAIIGSLRKASLIRNAGVKFRRSSWC